MTFLDSLVGPLHQNYCYYFYVGALFFLVMFLAAVFGCVAVVFTNKKSSLQTMSLCTLNTLTLFILYLVNRLMYNMCRNSMN